MFYYRCFAKDTMEEIIGELEKDGTEWAKSKVDVRVASFRIGIVLVIISVIIVLK